MNFYERLCMLRKERKETQVQVAEAIGITDRQYQRFEAGSKNPVLTTSGPWRTPSGHPWIT